MDRGAARSRKRAEKLDRKPNQAYQERTKPTPGSSNPSGEAGPSRPFHARRGAPRPQDGRPPKLDAQAGISGRKHQNPLPAKRRGPPEPQSRDPELYKPKAIRSSTALIWSESTELPPTAGEVGGYTRIDLSGSEVKDIAWLKDAGAVRWLSLNGCHVAEPDWEVLGQLTELTVLNINDCGLQRLPVALKSLGKLKALVAMNNPWKTLDDEVVSQWTELNSLIISHSPNLVSLPGSLNSLHHLSKLTFSHCPKFTTSSLPDCSSLPLLRDVKMNNLPLLTSLPKHINTWGTGRLSLVNAVAAGDSESDRKGQGLEVLDLGNCSLPVGALSTWTTNKWPNLRSLTLVSNPLCATQTDYAEVLQNSIEKTLPKLQIIDTKRIVERRKKGQVSERKVKEKFIKGKPTGTNVGAGDKEKMRKWGTKGEGEDKDGAKAEDADGDAKGQLQQPEQVVEGKGPKRKREDDGSSSHSFKRPKDRRAINTSGKASDVSSINDQSHHKSKTATATAGSAKPKPHTSRKTSPPPPSHPPRPDPAADPSALSSTAATKTSEKLSKVKTSVVGVIDVLPERKDKGDKAGKGKKGKGKELEANGTQANGGVDLRAVFGKPAEQEEGGSGLGVGGW